MKESSLLSLSRSGPSKTPGRIRTGDTVGLCLLLFPQWCRNTFFFFFLHVGKFLSKNLFGLTVNAHLGSVIHIAAGQKDGLLCSMHDLKPLPTPALPLFSYPFSNKWVTTILRTETFSYDLTPLCSQQCHSICLTLCPPMAAGGFLFSKICVS